MLLYSLRLRPFRSAGRVDPGTTEVDGLILDGAVAHLVPARSLQADLTPVWKHEPTEPDGQSALVSVLDGIGGAIGAGAECQGPSFTATPSDSVSH